MKYKAGFFGGVGMIILSVLFLCIYWYLGLQHIFDVLISTSSKNRDEQERIKLTLSDSNINAGLVKGILLGLNYRQKPKGLWFWNYDGIKYYKIDQSADLKAFSICQDDKWKRASGELVLRDNINYGEWQGKIRKGDYLELLLNDEGNIMNAVSYDWWVFAQPLSYSDLEQTCKNR